MHVRTTLSQKTINGINMCNNFPDSNWFQPLKKNAIRFIFGYGYVNKVIFGSFIVQ